MTRYELTWGASGVVEPSQKRMFDAPYGNDAIVRFSERVVELDRDARVSAGWVHLNRLSPDGHIAAWTKTSDECPTKEGDTA
jgi:hypothetical protein